MNLIFKNINYIIMIILVVIIFLQRACAPDPYEGPDMKEYIKIGGTEYEYLKSQRTVVYKPETFYVKGDPIPGKTIYKEIPADVDTAAILADYFAIRPYSETVEIKPDTISYGTVTVTDSVHQNKLYGRKYNFDLLIPEYTNTFVVKEKPRNKFYIGGGMNFDKVNLLNSVYGGMLLQTKKDHMYGLNLGINTNGEQVTPFIGGSIYWKIRFKKQTTQYSKMSVDAAQLIINNMD